MAANTDRSSKLTPEQQLESRKIFNEIDASGYGELDKEQFCIVLDVSGHGEFICMLAVPTQRPTPHRPPVRC